jgi:hypothetical protein
VKTKIPFPVFAILFIGCILLPLSTVLAQGDNPRVDALPLEWIQNINYSDAELDVITTPDGFDNFNLGVDFAEPHITQNPTNPLQYFNAFNINGAWRTSDGHDWIHFTPSFGTTPRGDPVTAYDSLGHLYYENMYGSISGCKVLVSTNNGQSWGAPVTSILGGDKNWIAADQTSGPYANYVYTTMTRPGFSGHAVARSTDYGVTWNQTGTFSNSPLPGAMVAVGPNVVGGDVPGGAVYVVTNSGSAFASIYTFYLSTDGGATWTIKSNQFFSGYVGSNVNGRNSVQNMRTRPYPFIAVDNSYGSNRGRLYLVYASNSPSGNGNKPDIFCRYSTDQGVTWSSAVTVNDDANSQNHNQWHPSIWNDKQTGRLFVKWMDTRDTPTSDSAYIYASYSDDGGLTFATNQRISNAKMRINCTTCGGGGNPRYQGDYDAIVSLDGQALGVWTDFRSGNFGSYVGYFPDFAMLVSPTNPVIDNTNGNATVTVEVPAVKLYSNDAIFSASLNTTPASGTLNLTFPSGNTLSSFPGSVQLEITTTGTVTNGSYGITIVGEGPNGTPVHRRTVTLTVQDPIPVELTSFSSVVNENDVFLSWQTATETNNQGFEVERSSGYEYRTVGFVPGHGTTTEIQSYTFIDENVDVGNYTYRLKQIDYDGTIDYSNVVEVVVAQPLEYKLSQNYPNPFNPSTTISYSISKDGLVTLIVYDVLGNAVSTLVNEFQPAGQVEIIFDASELSSGVYYYQLVSGDFTSTKKLILMK